jgi:hypothetical protein
LAGRSPRETADAFLGYFNQTLSCITDSFIKPSGYAPEPALQSVTLVPRGGQAGDPVPLRTEHGRRGILLSVGHDYRIVRLEDEADERGPWQMRTAKYAYVILDEQGNELLTYHWHPEDPFQPSGRSKVQSPHLHVAHTITSIPLGRNYADFALAEMHIRTGQVLLEDIVELLIDECGIHPLKDYWREIVDENRKRVRAGRTW